MPLARTPTSTFEPLSGYGEAMPISITLLKAGGSSYTVEEADHGFLIHVVTGDEANFNIIARRLINEAGPTYAAFPRSDGNGGYDCVHIIPHDPI